MCYLSRLRANIANTLIPSVHPSPRQEWCVWGGFCFLPTKGEDAGWWRQKKSCGFIVVCSHSCRKARWHCYTVTVILPCPTKGYVGAWWLTREVSTRSLTYIMETTAFCYRDLVRKGFASKYIPLPSKRFASCESLFFGGGKKCTKLDTFLLNPRGDRPKAKSARSALAPRRCGRGREREGRWYDGDAV